MGMIRKWIWHFIDKWLGFCFILLLVDLISCCVCLCARYQANPKELHLSIVKCIMRYLVGTPHLGLWYPKLNTCSLLGYLDVDFAGSRIDRKSTLEGCQFLSHSLAS